jgi:hypothetical protein
MLGQIYTVHFCMTLCKNVLDISVKGYCDHCKYARRLCGPNGSCEVRPKRIEERLYLVLLAAVNHTLKMKGR